jgi:phosphoglycolate phosphatase
VSRLKAVVFDLDGTLVDSLPDIAAALNDTLQAHGRRALHLADVSRLVGGGARTLIERALNCQAEMAEAARIEALLDEFLTRYRAAPCVHTRVYPGAREALDALRREGYALGICTNKPADLTELVLAGLGLRPYFDSVVAATPVLPAKPDPRMLLKAMDELGVEPALGVMVGDSAADAGSARAAGMRCILLSHGYSAVPAALLGADVVMAGFAEFIQALVIDAPGSSPIL